jgi:hypothetical protein
MPAFIEQSRGGWQRKTVKMSPYRTVRTSPARKNKCEPILLEQFNFRFSPRRISSAHGWYNSPYPPPRQSIYVFAARPGFSNVIIPLDQLRDMQDLCPRSSSCSSSVSQWCIPWGHSNSIHAPPYPFQIYSFVASFTLCDIERNSKTPLYPPTPKKLPAGSLSVSGLVFRCVEDCTLSNSRTRGYLSIRCSLIDHTDPLTTVLNP